MKSMMFSDNEKKEKSDTLVAGRPNYPYGLRISLDKDSLEKLGMVTPDDLPKLKSKLFLCANCEVVSVNTDSGFDGSSGMNVTLQITEMEFEDPKEEKDEKSSEEILYGKKG